MAPGVGAIRSTANDMMTFVAALSGRIFITYIIPHLGDVSSPTLSLNSGWKDCCSEKREVM
jgi:hypothetical protein